MPKQLLRKLLSGLMEIPSEDNDEIFIRLPRRTISIVLAGEGQHQDEVAYEKRNPRLAVPSCHGRATP